MASPDAIFLLIFFSLSTVIINDKSIVYPLKQKFNNTIIHNLYKTKSKIISYYNYSKYKQNNCPICLEVIHKPYVNICGHAYHKTCIFKWNIYNNTCPICRETLDILLLD